MKEAILINLDGHMMDVTLVASDVTGVFPIYEAPLATEADPTPEPVLVGYQVAVKPPEGLYKLQFDLDTETWGEGLTQEQINALHVSPTPSDVDILGAQLVEKDLQIMDLRGQLEFVGSQVVSNDLRLLQLEGGVPA